jgi:23S rRNA pseudouridine2604 synthase
MDEETAENKITYPIRINRYLALNNICSRREADALISAGKVKLNGKIAKLGDHVRSDTDKVDIFEDGEERELIYLAFNKPRGVVTHSPQWGQKGINDIFQYRGNVAPVGRLDKDSYGLILLTNDGRVPDKLLSPDREHEKEYVVRVDRPINDNFIAKISREMTLGDGTKTKPCVARQLGDSSFSIILTEGKNRQIRRMCEIYFRSVLDLRRVRIMNIGLGDLRPGQYRVIKDKELRTFLTSLGLE